jgi:hypothetical protein
MRSHTIYFCQKKHINVEGHKGDTYSKGNIEKYVFLKTKGIHHAKIKDQEDFLTLNNLKHVYSDIIYQHYPPILVHAQQQHKMSLAFASFQNYNIS